MDDWKEKLTDFVEYVASMETPEEMEAERRFSSVDCEEDLDDVIRLARKLLKEATP